MKAARAVRRSMMLTGLTAVSACQLVGGYDQFTPFRDGGAGSGAGGADSSVDSGAPSLSCADLPNAEVDTSNMRRVSNGSTCFWMDRTEVSRAQYWSFLEGLPSALGDCDNLYEPAPVAASAGETCHVPEGVKVSTELDHPIVCVDWCDARAYCVSLGKSLCKDTYGVPSTPAGSDWYAACSNAGQTDYPFGNAYEELCNDVNHRAAGCGADLDCLTTVPVASLDACANRAGVLHLTGNVQEWTEACSGDACYVRGGSMQSDNIALQCGRHNSADRRITHDATIGFRCCHYP